MFDRAVGRYVRKVAKSLVVIVVAITTGGMLGGCSLFPSFPSEDAPSKIVSPVDGYLLEPGNQVHLSVFGQDNLSGTFTLDSVGNIALPLLGNVPAGGVTAAALANRVETILRKDAYMQDPKVSVEIQTFRPFYVLGEVRTPGEFPYMTGMTVLSAVAKAGGYEYRALEGEVLLVRQQEGQQKEYRAVERTPILPGDIIKVLQRRF